MHSDSPEQIAADLNQLADEVAGNESRPAADDIAARVRQIAGRVVALRSGEDRRQSTTPVLSHVTGFAPAQTMTGNHPRLATSTPPVEGVDDFGKAPENEALPPANDAVPPTTGNEL